MDHLQLGKLYTLEMEKSFPSFTTQNPKIKYSEVEYIGRKGPKHHFFIWDDGKDVFLSKEEVKNYIR